MFPQTPSPPFTIQSPRYSPQNTKRSGVAFTLAKKQVNVTSDKLRLFLGEFHVYTLILPLNQHKNTATFSNFSQMWLYLLHLL